MFQLTAAHGSVPFGTVATVTNLDTGHIVHVRINDRGPFVGERVLDLSYAAAHRLNMVDAGLARVRVEFRPMTAASTDFIVQAVHTPTSTMRCESSASGDAIPAGVDYDGAGRRADIVSGALGAFASRDEAEYAARQVQALGYAASVYPPATSIRDTYTVCGQVLTFIPSQRHKVANWARIDW